jgi:hypothetical protein
MRARRNCCDQLSSGYCGRANTAKAIAFAEDVREATLSSMDRVRFGRALGFGARQAVKTLTIAVDAATAPNPAPRTAERSANAGQGAAMTERTTNEAANAAASAARNAPLTPAQKTAQTAARKVAEARQVNQGLRRGTRRFGEAVWRPFVRLSGVLWLEVSGVFFGIFALLALGYVLKLRGAWRAGAGEHRSLIGALAMLALFGYFCVSNFVRARQRERRR